MRNIFLFAVIMVSTAGLFAQDKKNDTLKIKWRHSKIWIFDNKEKAKTDTTKKRRKDFTHWAGIDLGVAMLTTIDNRLRVPDELDSNHVNNFIDLNYGKSWFFSLNLLEKNFRIYKNYVNVVTGLGMEWNSYNFNKNITLNPDASYISNSNTTIAPDSIKYFKNKLKATFIKVPLIIEINTNSENPNRSFHIAGGIELGYKIGSKTKQKYEMNGNEIKVKRKDDYHLENIKYSYVVRIGYGNYFTLFANYGFSDFFEGTKSPEVFPVTAGISVSF